MKLRNRLMAFLMTLALVIGLIMPTQVMAAAASEGGFDIDTVAGKTVVLHTNDTHGRVQRGTDSSLGMSAIAALKDRLEEAGATVLLLDAGDTLHGKPIATLDQGETIVKIMNAVGYDAMTLGNHDFNYGTARLAELIEDMDFPAVAANVLVTKNGNPFTKEYTIIEKDGVRYGIFGLATEETETKTNPNNVKDITFLSPIEMAQSAVYDLEREGVDFIIALGHIGIDGGSDPTAVDVIEAVDGIDLFIDGHSHSSLEACAAANEGNDTLLVSTGEYLQNIGCVVIDTENDYEMEAYSLSTADLAAAGVKTELAEGEDETAIHEEVGKLMIEAEANLSANLSQVIGTTSVYLDGEREHVRTTETNLGNLAADALRWATGADIAFTNGGGIRTSIQIGDITKGMLAEVFPFGNIVVTKKVSGQAILLMLEHGVKDYPATSGGFPQTSGLTFTIDANKEAGSRISNVKVNGEALDLDKMYVLASNDFTIAGGDGYTMISDELFPKLMEYGALDEVLIQYFQTNPDPATYAVGRTLTVQVGETAPVVTETPEQSTTVTEKPANGTTNSNVTEDKKEEVAVEETVTDTTTEETVTIYTVQKGDCLSKIAKKLLGKASDWTLIYKWNKDTIKNPDFIQIGQELLIYAE